ncbi:General alpha-glucoside permease [Lasiodiplodia hormozganensis]|uniref:General alpha-glucoside permease n=1 Tax=Lasiodiplodia hormozganensis TaxID=869390 RepID=A0AA39X0A0_9PEZI|nr:General alpha-glucoside permease [Lasiodiplodia hormozganensis]
MSALAEQDIGQVPSRPDENSAAAMAGERIKASEAAERETTMSLWMGLKLYPKAVAFSAAISACIIMEGYDVNLLQGLFAFAPFQRKYGHKQADGSYQLSAAWQAGLANGAAVGEILGLFLNGIISERIGYRRTLLWSLSVLTGFIFILFFAPSVEVLQVGEILCGIPWGVFQTLTTVYASEVCPVALRAYLTTYVNLCWVIGTLLGQGILRACLESSNSEWAYRIPFAIQWVWPVPIALAVLFAPESPWWLIRQNRLADARTALSRLTSAKADPDFDVDATVAMMHQTHLLETAQHVAGSSSSYADCFRGVDLRRTEITCMVWAIQNLSGSGFMGYSTYFFQQAGLDGAQSFNVAMGQYALGAVGTLLSWGLMARFGRRDLYLYGLVAQLAILLATGCLGVASDEGGGAHSGVAWGVAALMVLYTFVYDMTVGPVCYALVPEMPASRLRTRTVVLGRNLYNVINIVMNVIIPYMLNPSAWNWKAKAGFFYAGLCALCVVWTFFRLPEPKGRTYAELDILFRQGVPARKFKETVVDAFGTQDAVFQVKSGKHDQEVVSHVERAE